MILRKETQAAATKASLQRLTCALPVEIIMQIRKRDCNVNARVSTML